MFFVEKLNKERDSKNQDWPDDQFNIRNCRRWIIFGYCSQVSEINKKKIQKHQNAFSCNLAQHNLFQGFQLQY